MRELTDFEKNVQSHITEILKDNLDDYKKVVKRLQTTIVLLIVLLVGSFIFYIYNFLSFIGQYDVESTVTTTTTTSTNANNDNKVYDKNSSIKADISDIKVNTNVPISAPKNKK